MKNWEVAQKKISEMNKDEFIEFIGEIGDVKIHKIAIMCDAEHDCDEVDLCSTKSWSCKDCLKKIIKK